MKIKNTRTSAIGFGSVTILPDTIGELPREFNATHPVLKYYISRGWVEVVDGATAQLEKTQSVAVNIAPPSSGQPNTENDVDNDKGDSTKKTDKALNRMSLDELRVLAGELGLEFTENDTRPILIDKINIARESNK
jgi:hypothetical protein